MASVDIFKEVHNSPVLRLRKLQEQIDLLKKEVEDYAAKEGAREEAARATERLQWEATQGIESAEPVEHEKVHSVTVEWLSSLGNECRRAKIIIPDQWESPQIFAMADQQLGHVCCDVEKVVKDINWVSSNPETLLVLLGDGIDSATKTSPGSIRENVSPPIQQCEDFVDKYRPVADRIIGMVGGNHEWRIDKALDEAGVAIRLMALGLSTHHKIPFSNALLLLDVYWKGHLWTFTLFHGAGAAQTAGGKTMRLQKNMLITDSLITLSGHLHDEHKTTRTFMRRQPDGSLKPFKTLSIQCGSYLKYLGSYAERAGMVPGGADMVLITLHSNGKYIDRFKGDSEA